MRLEDFEALIFRVQILKLWKFHVYTTEINLSRRNVMLFHIYLTPP